MIELSIGILTSAVLTVVGYYRNWKQAVYLFKPLTMIGILVLAWMRYSGMPSSYGFWILIGLVFSLAGDVFLMLPKDRFLAGLASFFVAHVAYIAAFYSWVTQPIWFIAIAVLIFAGLMLRLLWPSLKKQLKLPVVFYIGIISVMVWLAVSVWLRIGDLPAERAALGAVLFMISDSALAINRFHSPFSWSQALVLGTYFPAQWLIALSI